MGMALGPRITPHKKSTDIRFTRYYMRSPDHLGTCASAVNAIERGKRQLRLLDSITKGSSYHILLGNHWTNSKDDTVPQECDALSRHPCEDLTQLMMLLMLWNLISEVVTNQCYVSVVSRTWFGIIRSFGVISFALNVATTTYQIRREETGHDRDVSWRNTGILKSTSWMRNTTCHGGGNTIGGRIDVKNFSLEHLAVLTITPTVFFPSLHISFASILPKLSSHSLHNFRIPCFLTIVFGLIGSLEFSSTKYASKRLSTGYIRKLRQQPSVEL